MHRPVDSSPITLDETQKFIKAKALHLKNTANATCDDLEEYNRIRSAMLALLYTKLSPVLVEVTKGDVVSVLHVKDGEKQKLLDLQSAANIVVTDISQDMFDTEAFQTLENELVPAEEVIRCYRSRIMVSKGLSDWEDVDNLLIKIEGQRSMVRRLEAEKLEILASLERVLYTINTTESGIRLGLAEVDSKLDRIDYKDIK